MRATTDLSQGGLEALTEVFNALRSLEDPLVVLSQPLAERALRGLLRTRLLLLLGLDVVERGLDVAERLVVRRVQGGHLFIGDVHQLVLEGGRRFSLLLLEGRHSFAE